MKDENNSVDIVGDKTTIENMLRREFQRLHDNWPPSEFGPKTKLRSITHMFQDFGEMPSTDALKLSGGEDRP